MKILPDSNRLVASRVIFTDYSKFLLKNLSAFNDDGGPLMDSMSRNVRLELVLQILENYNRDAGITASEVVKIIEPKVSVSQRTILRDLRDLSLMHPICETTIEGKTYWRLAIDKTLKDQLNLRRLQLTEELIRILKLTAGSPNL